MHIFSPLGPTLLRPEFRANTHKTRFLTSERRVGQGFISAEMLVIVGDIPLHEMISRIRSMLAGGRLVPVDDTNALI